MEILIDGFVGLLHIIQQLLGMDMTKMKQYIITTEILPGLLWANVMSRVHTGYNTAKFDKPNTIISQLTCSKTGKKATSGCTNTYLEHYLWLTTPGTCTTHSGSELKNNNTTETNKTNTTNIVKGITEDIDVEELPIKKENTQTNNNSTNSNNTSTNSNSNQTTINNNINNNSNTQNTSNTDISNDTSTVDENTTIENNTITE